MGIMDLLTGKKTPEGIQLTPEEQEEKVIESDVGAAAALKDIGQVYDQEWVKFLSELSNNESTRHIMEYIDARAWTEKQKSKMLAFAQIALGKNVGATYITSHQDYMMALDDFTLAEIKIPLGLTVYDMSSEFLMVTDLIKAHFLLSLRRSKAGFFMQRIGSSRVEVARDNNSADQDGYKNQKKGNSIFG